MHDTIMVGILVLAILFGILFNHYGLVKVEGRFKSRFARLEERMNIMQADLARCGQILGEHGARIEALVRKVRPFSTSAYSDQSCPTTPESRPSGSTHS